MTYLTDMHHAEIGYNSNPTQPDSDFDRYENEYDGWINDNYDASTDTVCGVPYDEAWESESLFAEFMDYRRSLREE